MPSIVGAVALLLVTERASAKPTGCCWCDGDTPDSASTTVGADGDKYSLIFSDEFNQKDREFANGRDSKWTALEIGDTSNKGTAFYLPEQATIAVDDAYPTVSAMLINTENASHLSLIHI